LFFDETDFIREGCQGHDPPDRAGDDKDYDAEKPVGCLVFLSFPFVDFFLGAFECDFEHGLACSEVLGVFCDRLNAVFSSTCVGIDANFFSSDFEIRNSLV